MQSNPVGWFELYVQDIDRAKAFYEAVFGTTLDPLPPPAGPDGGAPEAMELLAFPMSDQTYGAAGALVRMEGVSSGGSGTMVYFSCEDCAAEAARAARSGGSVVRGKTSIGQYGFMAIVKDTEGNVIGLHSMQ